MFTPIRYRVLPKSWITVAVQFSTLYWGPKEENNTVRDQKGTLWLSEGHSFSLLDTVVSYFAQYVL